MSATMTPEETRARFGDISPPAPADQVDIVDFSYRPRPIKFRIDDEVYDCRVPLAVTDLPQVARTLTSSQVSPDDPDGLERVLGAAEAVFRVLLVPTAAERFITRLRDPDRPLDLTHQVLPILQYVLERHGIRPTEPPSPSSSSSPSASGGITSTAGAPSTGSTR